MRSDVLSKRVFDLCFSTLGLVFLSPLLVLVAVLTKLGDGGPVFFRQERVGRDGKSFRIVKFRTMVVGSEQRGAQITATNDVRITRSGRLLRKTKLDELPQLWNVFRGEMSLVGPRPEVPQYVKMYTDEQRQILTLLPGITDLASVTFYNEEDILEQSPNREETYIKDMMPEKIRLNLEYASHASVATDFRLIIRTFARMARFRRTNTRG